jgi:hypothetical protein
VDLVTLGAARTAAADAGLEPAVADTLVTAYADAQVAALRGSLGVVALIAVCGLWATRRLPSVPLAAEPTVSERVPS